MGGAVSHVSMLIFQTFRWDFGKQHSFGCQLGSGSPRVPCSLSGGLALTAVSWPTLWVCFVSWGSPSGPAHAIVGPQKAPPGAESQSLLGAISQWPPCTHPLRVNPWGLQPLWLPWEL